MREGWIRTTNANDEQLRIEKGATFLATSENPWALCFLTRLLSQWLPDYEAGAFANSATSQNWLPVRVTLPVGFETRRLQRLLALYETTWQ